jgi:hypothetical protein
MKNEVISHRDQEHSDNLSSREPAKACILRSLEKNIEDKLKHNTFLVHEDRDVEVA